MAKFESLASSDPSHITSNIPSSHSSFVTTIGTTYQKHYAPTAAATMMSPSLILVVILALFLSPGTEAFAGSNSSRQRRGARGQASARTSPATSAATTVLHMAPKKAKKSAGETLRKKDLVAAVAEACEITKVDAEAAVSAVFDTVADVSEWRNEEHE